jgi:hypothetical protein
LRTRGACQNAAKREKKRDIFGMKKKPYSPPALRNLTPEQAKKIIADRKNCSEEEAGEFLESLRHRQQQNSEEQNEPRDDAKGQKPRRSA